MNHKKEYAFVPCGHLCLCESCVNDNAHNKLKGECPICRTKATFIIKIFF